MNMDMNIIMYTNTNTTYDTISDTISDTIYGIVYGYNIIYIWIPNIGVVLDTNTRYGKSTCPILFVNKLGS